MTRFLRRWKFTILLVVIMAVLTVGIVLRARDAIVCHDSGGHYVMGFLGWECIQ